MRRKARSGTGTGAGAGLRRRTGKARRLLPHTHLFGLLDEALDGPLGVGDDDSVLARLLDLGDHDGAFLAVGAVVLEQLDEREAARNVAVEHKERVTVLEQLASECKGAGCKGG